MMQQTCVQLRLFCRLRHPSAGSKTSCLSLKAMRKRVKARLGLAHKNCRPTCRATNDDVANVSLGISPVFQVPGQSNGACKGMVEWNQPKSSSTNTMNSRGKTCDAKLP
ncbi:unnamed protein product [Soboliphyme baturini]|uniref:Secreted protein n=1 Tax=Soboliphyme baturini TaxID=241478 RepID=A0A183IHZ6_9BILA|nr:unnamed protein product [Soboliphyme baturini]